MEAKRKTGIFGGTFNPPHSGHRRLADLVAEKLGLDRVIIIPSCVPPHKLSVNSVPAEDRLKMCSLAFDSDIYEVSDMEIVRGSKSYTVDTLRVLKEKYPDDELFFIMGSDMLESFRMWYRWEEILSLVTICAASRKNGFIPDLEGYTQEQRDKIIFIEAEPFEISSTELRMLIKNNSDVSALIHGSVEKYIKTNGLYDDDLDSYRKILSEMLDTKRLYHSECVSESAWLLAQKYGADAEKARLAGLLHDITKQMPEGEQLALMGEITPLEKSNRKVWHQISAPVYLRKNNIVTDPEILSAIRWHTTGKADMTILEKIVYVADFISSDRKYPDVETVRKLAYISLEHAMLYTGRYTISSLVKADRPLHPATLDCYNDMLKHFGL